MPDIDDILMQLGKYGKWQIITYSIICLAFNWPITWEVFAIVFVGPAIPHTCHVPVNFTTEECIPYDKYLDGPASCYIFSNCTSISGSGGGDEIIPCTQEIGWDYDFSIFKKTITSDWDLVCKDEALVSLAHTILIIGAVAGSLILGPLSDKIGRKPVFIVSIWCTGITGLAQAFSPAYWVFGVFQALKGFFVVGGVSSGLTLACELFPADQRIISGIWLQAFWATGLITLSGFAYFLRDWTELLIGISVPFVLSVSFIWAIPESIQWLVTTGRVEKARDIFIKAAKMNNIPIDTTSLDKADQEFGMKDKEKEAKYTSPFAIFYAPKMRRFTFLIMLQNTAVNFAYWGLSFDSASLGDPYLGFFVNSLVELPATFICLYTVPKWGRRWNIAAFYFLAAPFMLAVVFIPTDGSATMANLNFACIMIGKFAISAVFLNLMFYMPEMYPTTHRNLGLGPTYLLGLVAGMVSPYILLLAKEPGLYWLPNVLFTGFAILGGFAMILMPETVNRPLAETIEEMQGWDLKVNEEEKQQFLEGMAIKRRDSEAKVAAMKESQSTASLVPDPENLDMDRRRSSALIKAEEQRRRSSALQLADERRKHSSGNLRKNASNGTLHTNGSVPPISEHAGEEEGIVFNVPDRSNKQSNGFQSYSNPGYTNDQDNTKL